LDVLRGFAVLGILVMNIQAFSMPGSAYINPTTYGDLTGGNFAVWLVSHVFADAKFMTIFSMLFGAGIVLMTSRREEARKPSAGVHYRRMGVLLAVALVHAYLLWYGDILYTYAMCGFLAYLFRKWRPVTLLLIGGVCLAIGSGISIFFGLTMPYWPAEAVQNMQDGFWQPSQETVAIDLAAYRGSWLGQVQHRAPTCLFFQTMLFLIEFCWRAGGLMLVGMALFKWRVFSAGRTSRTYWIFVVLAVFVGIPVVLYGDYRNFAAEWDIYYSFFLGTEFNYWGSLFVALGWVGLVMLVCRYGVAPRFRSALAATGQMAFTNYLVQTIICTTIFYGHGFGLYGSVSRVGQAGIVLAVWVFQLIVSPLWLGRFRFGPAEWAWRSLTYMRLQPMRRAVPKEE
jgi:uncharacterized protein